MLGEKAKLSYTKAFAAGVYAAAGYAIFFVLVPRFFQSGYGQAVLEPPSLATAALLVLVAAISALFSGTRVRGFFPLALGFISYVYITLAFPTGEYLVHQGNVTLSLGIGYVISVMKVLALLETARGFLMLITDNDE